MFRGFIVSARSTAEKLISVIIVKLHSHKMSETWLYKWSNMLDSPLLWPSSAAGTLPLVSIQRKSLLLNRSTVSSHFHVYGGEQITGDFTFDVLEPAQTCMSTILVALWRMRRYRDTNVTNAGSDVCTVMYVKPMSGGGGCMKQEKNLDTDSDYAWWAAVRSTVLF